MALSVVLALVAIVVGYIRLAPSNPATWHVRPQVTQDEDLPGGAKRAVPTGPDGLARFHAVASAAPRTTVLAGSVEEGMVTYVTRSRVIGFPDYTTAWQDGDMLRIHARLRFGQSDLGVNRARVEDWLARMDGPATVRN